MLSVLFWAVTGGEQPDDAREAPRSPTVTASGAAVLGGSHAERGSTSSDSAALSSCANTDHSVNDRHSTDELTSKSPICLFNGEDAMDRSRWKKLIKIG